MKRWIVEILLGIVALGLVFAFTFPWGEETKEQTKRWVCLSNVKQRSLALIMYAEDANERFPGRVRWMDATAVYLRPSSSVDKSGDRDRDLRCPSVFRRGYGYAFDAVLSEKKSPAQPEAVPLVYDSSNLARNASDGVTSLPRPARHDGKDNVAYADGHAKTVIVP